MCPHLLANRVNLRESAAHGLRSSDFAGHPNRKKDRAKAALAHAGNINTAVGMARADVKFTVEEALCGVVVRVYDERGEMQLPGARGNIVRLHGHRQQTNSGNKERCCKEDSGHLNFLFSMKHQGSVTAPAIPC